MLAQGLGLVLGLVTEYSECNRVWVWSRTAQSVIGSGFGHLALAVPNIYEACEQMRKEGVTISRDPGPMKHGKSVIAFIEDPDGYKVELIERD